MLNFHHAVLQRWDELWYGWRRMKISSLALDHVYATNVDLQQSDVLRLESIVYRHGSPGRGYPVQ